MFLYISPLFQLSAKRIFKIQRTVNSTQLETSRDELSKKRFSLQVIDCTPSPYQDGGPLLARSEVQLQYQILNHPLHPPGQKFGFLIVSTITILLSSTFVHRH